MFKKLIKSTFVVALATAGSIFAMQNPQGRITVGLTPAQTAAQKAEFAKMIEARKAGSTTPTRAVAPTTAKSAPVVTPKKVAPAAQPARGFGRRGRLQRRVELLKEIQAEKIKAASKQQQVLNKIETDVEKANQAVAAEKAALAERVKKGVAELKQVGQWLESQTLTPAEIQRREKLAADAEAFAADLKAEAESESESESGSESEEESF